MKMRTILIVLSFLALFPAAASAQVCNLEFIDISCGDSFQGETLEGDNDVDGANCLSWDTDGPDTIYRLTLPQDHRVTVTVSPLGLDDPALLILPEFSGDCDLDNPVDCSDVYGDEVIRFDGTSGSTYYVVVDSWDPDYGTYNLSVVCEVCTDADGDGHYAIAAECPSGDDCCDTGSESSLGCTSVTAEYIFPGSPDEVCADGVDHDCDGYDCDSYCISAGSLDCDAGPVSGDNTAAYATPNFFFSYDCVYGYDHDGYEVTYSFEPDSSGLATVRVTPDANLNASVIVIEGASCDPASCIAGVNDAGTGEVESLTFPVSSSSQYFVIVDGYGSDLSGTFTIEAMCEDCVDGDSDGFFGQTAECPSGLDCNDGDGAINPDADEDCGDAIDHDCDGFPCDAYCYDQAALACGTENLAGDNFSPGSTNNYFEAYTACPTQPVGPAGGWEFTYSLDLAADAPVSISVVPESGFDPIVVVMRDQAGTCDIAECVALMDDRASGGTETLEVFLTAGRYYVMIDGYGSFANRGTFTISVSCDEICSDEDSDGFFGHDPQLCPSGTDCCDTGDEDSPGCEWVEAPNIHPDAEEVCGNDIDEDCSGAASLVCDGSCVDVGSDPANCGTCGHDCSAQVANVENATCRQGICDYDVCSAGALDCDGNRSNGCEQLEDGQHCGACDYDCGDYMFNVVNPLCVDGACDYDECTSGYLDCNDQREDGCELGESIDNCGACGYDCSEDSDLENVEGYTCTDGQCGYTRCLEGYDSCDGLDENGCEASLHTDEHCGSCETACGRLEACIQEGDEWVCSSACADADEDGHADASCGGDDCDDSSNTVYPGADESCNDTDDDCDGATDEGFDADGDGYKTCGAQADCDDSDPDVHPGAREICGNDVDEDCDGDAPACSGCVDADLDGYDDAMCGGDDCDDSNPDVHPDAPEVCNDIDDDCDEAVDEDEVCLQGASCGCTTGSSPQAVATALMMLLGLAWLRRRGD